MPRKEKLEDMIEKLDKLNTKDLLRSKQKNEVLSASVNKTPEILH